MLSDAFRRASCKAGDEGDIPEAHLYLGLKCFQARFPPDGLSPARSAEDRFWPIVLAAAKYPASFKSSTTACSGDGALLIRLGSAAPPGRAPTQAAARKRILAPLVERAAVVKNAGSVPVARIC